MADKTGIRYRARKWAWIAQERMTPGRPKWLHFAVCPFCMGYLLNRRALRKGWSA